MYRDVKESPYMIKGLIIGNTTSTSSSEKPTESDGILRPRDLPDLAEVPKQDTGGISPRMSAILADQALRQQRDIARRPLGPQLAMMEPGMYLMCTCGTNVLVWRDLARNLGNYLVTECPTCGVARNHLYHKVRTRKIMTQTIGCCTKNKTKPCVTDLKDGSDGVFELHDHHGADYIRKLSRAGGTATSILTESGTLFDD